MEAVIDAWRGDPACRHTLAGVRAGFLARQADAVQTGDDSVGELAHSVCNLLERIREGAVEPNTATVEAVADAAERIADPGRDGAAAAAGYLMERLDAYASGSTEEELGFEPMQRQAARDEPPLLTVRHDGVRVTPGSFEVAPAAGDGQARELSVLVEAWEAVGDQLQGELASLCTLAEGTADLELRRLAGTLQAARETIDRLTRTLSRHVRRCAGG